MKKTVSLILCLAMIFTLSPVTVAAERDISQTAPGINASSFSKKLAQLVLLQPAATIPQKLQYHIKITEIVHTPSTNTMTIRLSKNTPQ